MKRAGKLIESIADLANLEYAFYKAAKGKSRKKDVVHYRMHLNENLLNVRAQLLSGKVEIGEYHFFTIKDPKERVICAAPFPQRVLHHAIMNVCLPFFEQKQIFHSYACRKNKGTYAALDKAIEYSRKYKYYLKLDFRKYFESIDHQCLLLSLQRAFKDNHLMQIFKQIIDSYNFTTKAGIPIGNLSSQYFANHYLSEADHFALEILHAKAYIRYMDDVIMWDNSKSNLLAVEKKYREFCSEKLKLTLKPLIINKITNGLVFLGYKIYSNQVKLAVRSKKRFIQKYNQYLNNLTKGVWDQKTFQNHNQSLFAFTMHANTLNLRKKTINL